MANNNLIPITTGLTFKSTKLEAAYVGMKEAYDKAASAVTTAGNAVEEYSKTMGVIFARLTTDKNGKLDPDKNDGLKSVGEFAEKCGIKASTAYAWRNHALARQDEHLPDEIKNLPTSTFAALQSSLKRDEAEVIKAFKSGELSATSTQDEVRKWAKEHKDKSGAPRVVTQYTVFAFPNGKQVYDQLTMDEIMTALEHTADEVVRIPDALETTTEGKESKVKRLLTVSYEKGEVVLYMLRVHKPADKKPIANGQDLNRKAKWTEAVQKAKALGLSDEAVTDLLSDLYPEFYQ